MGRGSLVSADSQTRKDHRRCRGRGTGGTEKGFGAKAPIHPGCLQFLMFNEGVPL